MYQFGFDGASGESVTAMTVSDGSGLTSSTVVGGYCVPSNVVDYWQWPYSYPYVTPYVYVTTPAYPYYCTGEIHVFGCEHATKCKCGKASRKLEPKRCKACGK